MLYLKSLNGKFFVMHKSFPDGHLAAFTAEHIAREYVQWITDSGIDVHGFLNRLMFDKLTQADYEIARALDTGARHITRVISRKEPVAHRLARLRERVRL